MPTVFYLNPINAETGNAAVDGPSEYLHESTKTRFMMDDAGRFVADVTDAKTLKALAGNSDFYMPEGAPAEPAAASPALKAVENG